MTAPDLLALRGSDTMDADAAQLPGTGRWMTLRGLDRNAKVLQLSEPDEWGFINIMLFDGSDMKSAAPKYVRVSRDDVEVDLNKAFLFD